MLVSPETLRAELASAPASLVLVDVREPEEWAESRIEGAQLIPLGELLNRAPTELPDLDQNIVLYCAHGVRSVHALLALHSRGYSRLRSLTGGICEWEQLTPSARG